MLKNYLKIAFRNLLKEKQYSFINILGLAIGTAVAILMLLYVSDEWSFDRFHTKSDRIYRSWVKEHYEGELFFNTVTPFILGRELEANFPEIEEVGRVLNINYTIRHGEFSDQEAVYLVNPAFFEIFDLPLREGDPKQALGQLQQVVLSAAYAEKYFGTAKAQGKVLDIQIGGDWQQFEVTGILKEIPTNSSFQFDIVMPFENTKKFVSERARNSWTNVFPETYVLFKEGQDIKEFEAKLAPFIDKQVTNIYKPGEYIVGFQPLSDIHLNNDFPAGMVQVSDWRYPYILSAIAILILLLAGINFISLAIGRSVSRAKEVGVRKVSGATRVQLMQQFWSEAIVLTLLSVAVGLFIAEMAVPYFNTLADKSLAITYDWQTFLLLIALALLLGLTAGVYPALVVSGFSPILALHGFMTKLGTNKHVLLRSLVVFQFVLSVFLISCTFIMQQQLTYLQNKNLGFDETQILTFPYGVIPSKDKSFSEVYEEARLKRDLLENELVGKGTINSIAMSSHVMGVPGWLQLGYTDPESQKYKNFTTLTVDYNFLETMDIPLHAGRIFSDSIATDAKTAVIMNKIMAEQYDLMDKVGEQLPKPFEQFQLIGITEDFNFNSLHNPIEPLFIAMDPIAVRRVVSDVSGQDSPLPKYSLKIASANIPSTIKTIQQAWKKIAPDQSFNFSFVDQNLDQQYRTESRLSSILVTATILAILVACLGLFGIATLSITRRTKEIGVRKILGASAVNVLFLLNKRFAMMVLLANLIAAPIAYYVMKSWLNDFAYQTNISVGIFLLAAFITLGNAFLAVSYHSLKAAIMNPVKSLRYE